MITPLRFGFFLAAMLAFSACQTLGIPGIGEDSSEPEHPGYETFDPSEYNAPPPEDVEVEHDVPPRLMAGRVEVPNGAATEPREPDTTAVASAETGKIIEGYRIQVFSSSDRNGAERVRDEAVSWWESEFGRTPRVRIEYIRPYYRVRLGAFATERDAEAYLDRVRQKYSDAFTVPDRVTVGR